MKIIAGLAILVAILLYARSKQSAGTVRGRKKTTVRTTRTSEAPKLTQTSKFHAVSVQYSDNACTAAKVLEGTRILSSTTPQLPLPDCDAATCECRFIHHSDRRRGSDRRDPYNKSSSARKLEREKRHRGDRRSGGISDYFS